MISSKVLFLRRESAGGGPAVEAPSAPAAFVPAGLVAGAAAVVAAVAPDVVVVLGVVPTAVDLAAPPNRLLVGAAVVAGVADEAGAVVDDGLLAAPNRFALGAADDVAGVDVTPPKSPPLLAEAAGGADEVAPPPNKFGVAGAGVGAEDVADVGLGPKLNAEADPEAGAAVVVAGVLAVELAGFAPPKRVVAGCEDPGALLADTPPNSCVAGCEAAGAVVLPPPNIFEAG